MIFVDKESKHLPKPLLDAIVSFDKDKVAHEYSITELTAPLWKTYLRRKYNIGLGTSKAINVFLGLCVHKVIEEHYDNKRFVGENAIEFRTKVDKKLYITGRPDCYDKKEKILYDFKVIREHECSRMLNGHDHPEYFMQLNGYKVFGLPEAKKLVLVCIIKDWSQTKTDKSSIYLPIQLVEVPIMNKVEVKDYFISRARKLDKMLSSKEIPVSEACTFYEAWGGKRCRFYCEANQKCQELLGENFMNFDISV
ncbi:MAG: hypothetical protein QW279_08930 [Candidatus Jordarchaeaceae archaeon]